MSSLTGLGFTRLSRNLYIRQPPPSLRSTYPKSPTSAPRPLVLIATWMNARPRHIEKYTSNILSIFPDSKVLLLLNGPWDMLLASDAAVESTFQPGVDVIRDHVGLSASALPASPSSSSSSSFGAPAVSNDVRTTKADGEEAGQGGREGEIVGVAYSNGGISSLTRLAGVYKRQTGQPLPVRKMILDSAPGINGTSILHTALFNSLPLSATKNSWAIRWLASKSVWLAVYLLFALYKIRRADPITTLRRRFNDPTLFSKGRRVFVYGKGDAIIPFEAVESCAAEGEAKGWNTDLQMFAGSHVAHAVAEKARYWELVRRTLGAEEQQKGAAEKEKEKGPRAKL